MSFRPLTPGLRESKLIQGLMHPDIIGESTLELDSPYVPTLEDQVTCYFSDLIARRPPSSVLGILVDQAKPISVPSVAGLTGLTVADTKWTLDILDEAGLVAHSTERGHERVAAKEPNDGFLQMLGRAPIHNS